MKTFTRVLLVAVIVSVGYFVGYRRGITVATNDCLLREIGNALYLRGTLKEGDIDTAQQSLMVSLENYIIHYDLMRLHPLSYPQMPKSLSNAEMIEKLPDIKKSLGMNAE